MAITFNKNIMGKLVIKQDKREFEIEIRQGNCLAVLINRYVNEEGVTMNQLYSFYSDAKHLDNIIKSNGSPFFDEVVSIELNMKYKECEQLLRRFVKFHKVTCYYE